VSGGHAASAASHSPQFPPIRQGFSTNPLVRLPANDRTESVTRAARNNPLGFANGSSRGVSMDTRFVYWIQSFGSIK